MNVNLITEPLKYLKQMPLSGIYQNPPGLELRKKKIFCRRIWMIRNNYLDNHYFRKLRKLRISRKRRIHFLNFLRFLKILNNIHRWFSKQANQSAYFKIVLFWGCKHEFPLTLCTSNSHADSYKRLKKSQTRCNVSYKLSKKSNNYIILRPIKITVHVSWSK